MHPITEMVSAAHRQRFHVYVLETPGTLSTFTGA
jgi:hypothetical protein